MLSKNHHNLIDGQPVAFALETMDCRQDPDTSVIRHGCSRSLDYDPSIAGVPCLKPLSALSITGIA